MRNRVRALERKAAEAGRAADLIAGLLGVDPAAARAHRPGLLRAAIRARLAARKDEHDRRAGGTA